MTLPRRRTACRMRHCCARRIVETGGRRKLVCTSTRSAERHPQGVCRIRKAAEPPTAAQQRMIGAEANRLAMLKRQRRAHGSTIGKHCSASSCSLAMGIFSGRVKGRDISFLKRDTPPLHPPRENSHCRRAARRAVMLADCTSLRAAKPR